MIESILAKGICRSFQGRPVLRGVDLSVRQGEFVAIVGKSGAGKTTLLGVLGTHDLDFSGTLQVGGVDISGATAAELRRLRREQIGFVFQDFHLLPELSPLENTLLPAVFTGRGVEGAAASARKILEHLGVWVEGEPTNRLSRGERQRVAVARALVNRPRILLADEPTASLDEESEAVLFDLLQELREEIGFALVAVVHSTRALESAQRVLRLEGGELVEAK